MGDRSAAFEKVELFTHIKDIIPKNQADIVILYKICPNGKSLSDTFRLILDSIVNCQAKMVPIAKQSLNIRGIFGGGNNQNIFDAKQH